MHDKQIEKDLEQEMPLLQNSYIKSISYVTYQIGEIVKDDFYHWGIIFEIVNPRSQFTYVLFAHINESGVFFKFLGFERYDSEIQD